MIEVETMLNDMEKVDMEMFSSVSKQKLSNDADMKQI